MHTDLTFCPALAEMTATGSSVDQDGQPVRLSGVSSANSLLILKNLHEELRAARTLEVGLAFGGSCLVFAETHRQHGSPPARQHIAIDPFQSHLDYAGLAVVRKAGLEGYVEHIDAPSDRALPSLLDGSTRFDLAYIDGSHLFEDAFLDCHYVAQLLSPNGVVVFDDSPDPHVRKVLRFVRSNMGHVLREMDLSPFRPDRGKPLKYRLAQRLGRAQLTGFRKIGEGRRAWNSRLSAF